jgi:uncharacterized cysteine cluster protein YcgN (CxxCxxCC family)
MHTPNYWNSTPLDQLSRDEWELLCDGCGKCCLHKLQDDETDEVFYTRVSCRLLNNKSGRCGDYENRFSTVPDCMDVASMTDREMKWLPTTCAYRLRSESKDLPEWHPLISGHPSSVFKDPTSIRGRVVSETDVRESDLADYIIRWIEA